MLIGGIPVEISAFKVKSSVDLIGLVGLFKICTVAKPKVSHSNPVASIFVPVGQVL